MHKVEELIRACEMALPVTKDELVAALLPRVGLSSYPWVPGALPLGASRFGGPADLPAGVEWPRVQGRPLALLTQLNFGGLEIERFHPVVERLPRSGWLCLFLDVDGQARGMAGAVPGVVALQFGGDAGSLVRHDPAPAGNAEIWTQCQAVAVYPADHQLCLPDACAVDSPLPKAERDRYREAYSGLEWDIDELQRTRHEVTLLGTPTLFNPDLRGELEHPEEWMLLLQFDGECRWVAGASKPEKWLDQPTLGGADFVQYFVRRADYDAGRLERGYLDYMRT